MSKWLPDVAPTDRAADVAARSLAIRLDHVRLYLKRSVKKPDRPEHIHQLRVWSRRSEAALKVYADLLPPRRASKMEKLLKRIRRTAGRIRDHDVYDEKIRSAGSRRSASGRSEKVKAQRKLVALFEKLDCGRMLKKQSRKLIDGLHERNRRSRETFIERAHATLRPMVVPFFESTPGMTVDDSALHQFRIAGKEMRYAVELMAGAFPPEFREEIYPALTLLQEKLGTINDLALTVERLQEQIKEAGDPAALSQLGRRLNETNEQLAKSRQAFRAWWTPQAADSIRERFERFLDPAGAIR